MRLVVLLSCLAIFSAAHADSVQIPLPGLAGDFDSGFLPPDDAPRVRTETFTIPSEIVSIDQMRLVMSGENSDGWMICEYDVGGHAHQKPLSVVTQMRLVLTAETLGEGCFFGIVNLLTRTFVDESGSVGACNIGYPLEPDLLLNTAIHAELECNYSPPCAAWIDALVTLIDVRMVIDGQNVVAETGTRGQIKAFYR
jgi:hypothetical protein